jgi:hypothetical protein
MNSRWIQEILYSNERRLTVLETAAGITPDPKDVLELPVVRNVKPDAISQADLDALEKEKEAAWAARELAWQEKVKLEISGLKDRIMDEIRASGAIAQLQAAPGAAPAQSVEEMRKQIREELLAELKNGEKLVVEDDVITFHPAQGAETVAGATAPAQAPDTSKMVPPPIPPAGPQPKQGKGK